MSRRWSISSDVLAIFHRCNRRQRDGLIARFNQLAEFPVNSAKQRHNGPDQRLYEIAELAPWTMTYWVDPDGDVVRIIAIEGP